MEIHTASGYNGSAELLAQRCASSVHGNIGRNIRIAEAFLQGYAVSRVDFERYDDQNFQYIFSPKWSIIDSLPAAIFQGIPGLDMSLRPERYYRVNMTPYFISERTPGEGREDLWELLEEVGLDYYDRFEWLLRTNMRCGTDNLIVERAENPRHIILESGKVLPADLQPDD